MCILVRMKSFSKILRKPFIVQKKMIPHMKAKVVFIGKKRNKTKKFEKKSKWPTRKKARFPGPPILNIFLRKFYGLVLWLVGLNDAID